MIDIAAVTTRFGKAYDKNKKAKTWLEKQQKNLFKAFDDDLKGRQISHRSVKIPEGEDPEQYIKKYHPGWEIVGTAGEHVILEEDPSLLSHTFTNHQDGMVYGRSQVTSSPSLDDDRMRDEDPELWERITEWPEPWWSLVKDAVQDFTSISWAKEALDAVVIDYLAAHGVQKVLRDLNRLSTHDLARVERYILPGPVSVRLIPPRKAKPEELGDER